MKDEDKVGELRAATREANETLKDIRRALKDADALLDRMADVKQDLLTVSETVFGERMGEQVAAGLEHYQKTIGEQIEAATDAVYNRFDVLGRILLGKESAEDRTLVGIVVDRVERGGKVIERP